MDDKIGREYLIFLLEALQELKASARESIQITKDCEDAQSLYDCSIDGLECIIREIERAELTIKNNVGYLFERGQNV